MLSSKDFFIRNLEADQYRENFLVSAVVSILVIRLFLRFTGYPQLGFGDFHIAHMLWGGLFMVSAIIILLTFLSRASANIASILGGIGFGMFIDELGKVITSDNDYFFRPATAFIYIILVLIYLILKFIPHYRKITPKEYLVNAIDMVKESAINDFDIEEEKRAEHYLKKCDPKNPIVDSLTKLLKRIDATEPPEPSIYTRIRIFLRNYYYTLAQSGLIVNLIIVFLAVQTLRTFFKSATLLAVHPDLPFSEWGQLYSSSLAGAFVLIGLLALRFSRVEAFRFFRIAMLITILLTEFFAFINSEWYEVIILFANILILLIINYAMNAEKQKAKAYNSLS